MARHSLATGSRQTEGLAEEIQEETPSSAFDAIFNLFKNAITKNPTVVKKEWLCSKVLKDVIHKVPAKREEPRLFSQVFNKIMYG